MLKVTATISFFVIVALAGVFYYAGMFDTLVVTFEPRGPFKLIYREYRGPYKGTRFVMNAVKRYVNDNLHLQTDTGFAVFYDNPQSTDPDSLRSIGGIVSDSPGPVQVPYKNGIFKRTDAVVGHFYLRSFFSYSTGSYKFYSKLPRFITEKSVEPTGSVMEIYDRAQRSIWFIVPVGRMKSPVPPFTGSR